MDGGGLQFCVKAEKFHVFCFCGSFLFLFFVGKTRNHKKQSMSLPQDLMSSLLSAITKNLEELAEQGSGVAADDALVRELLSRVKESAACCFDMVRLYSLQLSDLSRFCRVVVKSCPQTADSVVAYHLRSQGGGYVILLAPSLGGEVRCGGLIVLASHMGKGVRSLFSQVATPLIASDAGVEASG